MTQLFAALGSDGAMCFVGEVPRGAACGCFCPECGSPMLAKQGQERDWHFAHEAGQERPECLAGAMNMLRRLVVEYLQTIPALSLPRYSRAVRVASTFGVLSEVVSWDAQFVGKLQWVGATARTGAVARGRLDNGIDAEIYLEFGDAQPRQLPFPASSPAAVVFWCTVPVASDLRKRLYAEQHIRKYGQFVWRHQPDVFGLIAAATKRIQVRVQADAEHAIAMQRRQADEYDRRREEAGVPALQQVPDPVLAAAAPAVPQASPESPEYSWAPGWKARSAFMFYRLRDGSAWVVYSVSDGSAAIAPWPATAPGWDEALPPSVGVADVGLQIYRAASTTPAIMYLSQRAKAVRVSSNPTEFDGA